ncbi:hypothetical protein HK100_006335 [Physocladia obscura]|uniref:Uncharacterized protein n=1 Tax=Physocladia obscura TaxID=109957 RepID=A0AAD5T604_9FUNG|nr:hypothetical protein HK100_006335 [Physocladia obscura]
MDESFLDLLNDNNPIPNESSLELADPTDFLVEAQQSLSLSDDPMAISQIAALFEMNLANEDFTALDTDHHAEFENEAFSFMRNAVQIDQNDDESNANWIPATIELKQKNH